MAEYCRRMLISHPLRTDPQRSGQNPLKGRMGGYCHRRITRRSWTADPQRCGQSGPPPFEGRNGRIFPQKANFALVPDKSSTGCPKWANAPWRVGWRHITPRSLLRAAPLPRRSLRSLRARTCVVRIADAALAFRQWAAARALRARQNAITGLAERRGRSDHRLRSQAAGAKTMCLDNWPDGMLT